MTRDEFAKAIVDELVKRRWAPCHAEKAAAEYTADDEVRATLTPDVVAHVIDTADADNPF